ncbi:GNAT family N-acetyltransferase [Pacificibacter marinus]|uniref:GNAT family N-acetyltransferase n=1 Tax=Pacificibacter marinus TaxID=658057 RepID=UPI001C06D57F|nr:GNAT family N-acetyltransferase [Pacificibacter marinus]MBU2867972.1 GNAT family N-acetyltransferase [Pacificibacter marinus]
MIDTLERKTATSDITIRPARRSDCRALARMIEELAKHHGDVPLISEDALRASVFTTEPWLTILVAEREERLVGYAGLVRGFKLHFGQRTLDLHHLFIAPNMRGKGVGRQLIDASISTARALDCVELTVSTQSHNTAAQNAYSACGFAKMQNAGDAQFVMNL